MEELKFYIKVQKVVAQLVAIVHKQAPEDLTELKEWLEKEKGAAEVIEMLTDDHQLEEEIALYQSCAKEEAKKSLRERIRQQHQRQRIVLYSRIAVIVILFFGAGIFIKKSVFTPKQIPVLLSNTSFTTPTLITVQGESIDLSNISGDSVSYLSENCCLRNKETAEYPQNNFPIALNQLIVPRQCNYQITLCDGSVVYLNAESRLEYPTEFAGDERRVRLTGEGYFEIRHDSRPFIVEVKQINIKVYGTKFNIRAYTDKEIKTVLLEGKIGISFQSTPGQEQILTPSQLSLINLETQQQSVVNTQIEKHIAWINGYLCYDGDSLQEMLQDIGRWYDIDFFFADQILKKMQVTASINKDASLKDILAMIQTTVNIKINQIERRYTITR